MELYLNLSSVKNCEKLIFGHIYFFYVIIMCVFCFKLYGIQITTLKT